MDTQIKPTENRGGAYGGNRQGGGAGGRRFGGRGGRPGGSRGEKPKPEYDQKMLELKRVARVVRGGRRFSFMLILVIGNRRGKVGVGVGKGGDVSSAMEKAYRDAKKKLVSLKLTKEFSLPHEVEAKFCSSRIVLRPAKGRGVAAGSSARAILTLGGIRDVSAKFTSKSKNKLNNARATMKALTSLGTVN
jgi:small subunit ribosomal protein S5